MSTSFPLAAMRGWPRGWPSHALMAANGGHSPIQVSSPRQRVGLRMRHPDGGATDGTLRPGAAPAGASAALEPVFVQIGCRSVAAAEQVELRRRLRQFVAEEVPGGEALALVEISGLAVRDHGL